MEKHPKSNKNSIKQHQDAVIDLFSKAKKDIYGEIPIYQTIPLRTPESLNRDYERQEALKSELKELVLSIYESYVADLKLLQAHNPDATLLDVQYDANEETITAPLVRFEDSFISSSQLGGSMGRNMGTARATAESDYLASIQKRTLLINDVGLPEDLYIVEITRRNSVVTDDIYKSWNGKDGDRVAHLAIDPTYNDMFAETQDGPMDQVYNFEITRDILKKAFPKTTN